MIANLAIRSITCILATAVSVSSLPDTSSIQFDPAITAANGGHSGPAMGNATFTCQALISAMGSQTTVNSTSGNSYNSLEDDNYSATCWLPAACIFSPTTSSQVARGVTILNQLNTTFAVRSGGHKDTPGFAGIGSNGVLISLQNLNRLDVSSDNSTINVGPGNRWEAVYSKLEPAGLTAIGGRVGIVGVAGFLLGGGVSYFTNQYGLGFDNIKSFEVVLGSGNIITASATENSDLYQGLRGGATNYGIVTNFELYTHPLGDFYYEARAYSLNQTSEFLDAMAAFQTDGQLDPLANIVVQIEPTGPVVLLQYAQPASHPSNFAPFYSITPYTQYVPPTNGSLSSLVAISTAGFSPEGIRTYGETFTHKVDASYMIEAYDIFVNETKNLPPGASGTWVPTAISANAVKYGQSQSGGNLLGLSAMPQQWHEWFITWNDTSQDAQIQAVASTITAKVTAAAQVKNLLLPYLFMNTAGTSQDVLDSFGAANVDKIKSVAAKYDPGKVYQRLQNKGYLIRDLSL